MDDRLSGVLEIADTVSAQMETHEQLDRSLSAVQMRISQMETDICSQASEIATVQSVTKSTEKDLGLMQVRLSRGECDIDRLSSEVQGFRTHSEVTAQQLTD
jgi:predicted  nucleic acid-binding Zn-ribbon protein